MNTVKGLNQPDFVELFRQILSLASEKLGRDEDYISGTIDKPLINCYDLWEYGQFLAAIEKQFDIAFDQYSDIVETLLDVAFYVYNYDFFHHGDFTPSIRVKIMMEIRNKMRPVLNSIWREEVVDDFYIYSPDSLFYLKRKLGLDPSLYWDMVPDDFALCFDNKCPLRNKCIRWQAGELLPDEIYTALCVMPCSRKGKNCWMYVCKDDAISYEDFFKQFTS